ITSPDYPDERLIVCRNPALAAERGRTRGELLEATELALRAIQTRVRRQRRPLRAAAAIGEAVGALLNRKKMAKHFTRTITDDDDRAAAQAQRRSPVAKATVSRAAQRKAASKRTDDGHPVHSFRTLLTDLATVTRNTVRFGNDLSATVLATPTPFQQHAFEML